MALHPQVLWAQRQNLVYITISVEDMEVQDLKIEGNKLYVKGTKGKNGPLYETDLELYGDLNGEMYKRVSTARALELIIPKVNEGWWPRFLKQSGRNPWLKIDFNKWKEEDESDDEDPFQDMGGFGDMFDSGKMKDMMSTYNDAEEGMDDDEDLPGLEDVDENDDSKKENKGGKEEGPEEVLN
ncbi:CS domain and HSP20-like chaperone domain-containing protein [Strongyloides ratti]|uniref:CS domain and HSP20-like chaperone domain-containing protein n=1 Tax=Strongyloides ratti TaxID=34506 RepID=A0A090LEC0_STRRB|nr:CS domain and HSP20-like chaperone domain-containing protein [Strongyloides ratti]CEF68121.1 CS domain and HSP20-like chaperone domain-containing protein [Strongyloides ratti]